MATWSVVGAGPAGILAIARLLDLEIDGRKILWIDNKFNVGRIGQYYRNVPSNNTVEEWIATFSQYKCMQPFLPFLQDTEKHPPKTAQTLGVAYHFLLDITVFLQRKVKAIQGKVKEITYSKSRWHLRLKDESRLYLSDKLILATGSHPEELNYQNELYQSKSTRKQSIGSPGGKCQSIDLDIAIDENKLREYLSPDDTVGIIGSGQSAVLLLKYLSDIGIPKTINFYKMSLEESVKSLRALTKKWALRFLSNTQQQESIIRVQNTSANREKWLPRCTKIIYAVGYERNKLPKIRGTAVRLDTHDGVIGPDLYGVGIAFPEIVMDSAGHETKKVGFGSFTEFLMTHVPMWLE